MNENSLDIEKYHSLPINTSDYASGVYLLMINNRNIVINIQKSESNITYNFIYNFIYKFIYILKLKLEY